MRTQMSTQEWRLCYKENMAEFTETEGDAWGGFLWTWSHMNRLIEQRLQAGWGISHAEFEVLLRLSWARQPTRIQDLQSQSIISQSGMSRLVARLEQAGFVSKSTDPADRRGALVELSAEGQARFAAALADHVELVRAKFLRHFTDAELKLLWQFWARVVKPAAD